MDAVFFPGTPKHVRRKNVKLLDVAAVRETLLVGRSTKAKRRRRKQSRISQYSPSTSAVSSSLTKARSNNEEEKRNEDVDEDLVRALGLDEMKIRALEAAEESVEAAGSLYLQAFHEFDVDGSGALSQEELQRVLLKLGEDEATFAEIIKDADADGDGSIDYEEFVNMMKARKRIQAMANTLMSSEGKQASHQVSLNSSQDLPPLNLMEAKTLKKTNGNMWRPTPHVLKTKRKVKQDDLRRELSLAQRLEAELSTKVSENVQWVQENCNVAGLRTRLYCKKWGVQKLNKIMKRIEHKDVLAAWRVWTSFVKWERNQDQVQRYMKLKGSKRVMTLFQNWKLKKLYGALSLWHRLVLEEKHREALHAAIKIQSVVRGHVSRKEIWKMRRNNAATCIQSCVRGSIGRKLVESKRRFLREYDAAVFVQRCYRGYAGKKLAIAILMAHRDNQAAAKIQSVWRGRKERWCFHEVLEMRLKNCMATKIAKTYRGHVDREIVKIRKQAIAEEFAAAWIQKLFRGYLGRVKGRREIERRMHVIAENEASLKIQCCFRSFVSKRQTQFLRSQCAACRIQNKWRVYKAKLSHQLVREKKTQLERAAIQIQSFMRSKLARSLVQGLRSENAKTAAATRIQTSMRGYLARRRFLEQKELRQRNLAAESIQARIRGHKVRKGILNRRLDEQRLAVTRIQAVQRGRLARKDIQRRYDAAVEIQRMMLGYKVRTEGKRKHGAATTIQASVRSRIAKKRVRELHAQKAQQALIKLQEKERRHKEDEKRRIAALQLQNAWQSKQARDVVFTKKKLRQEKENTEKQQAATRIQARFRVSKAKGQKRKLVEEKEAALCKAKSDAQKREILLDHNREQAALKIQTGFRAFSARQSMLKLRKIQETARIELKKAERTSAATKIQTRFRINKDKEKIQMIRNQLKQEEAANILAKEKSKRLAEEQQQLEEEDAAIVVQSALRRRKVQNELNVRRAVVNEEKEKLRAEMMEAKKQQARELSALKIQCVFRTNKAKRELDERMMDHRLNLERIQKQAEREEELCRIREEQEKEIAALRVQAVVRGKAVRLQVDAKLKNRNIALAKKKAELEQKQRETGALKLQAAFRGFQERKKLQKRQESKLTVISKKNFRGDVQSNDEWIQYWDAGSQTYYYYNMNTGEASWYPPNSDIGNPPALQDYDCYAYNYTYNYNYGYGYHQGGGYSDYYGNIVHNGANQDPEHWVQYYDDSYQSAYYYNTVSGETSWQPPPGFLSEFDDPRDAPRFH